MKEITLYVPDEKVEFVKELANQLGIDAFDAEEPHIPEEHKAIVLERVRTSKPEDLIPWEEARKSFTFKSDQKAHV